MSAMAIIIARERRIVTTGITSAIVNGIMPVVIVIGGDSIPAAIVRLERIMRPALAGISASNRDSLAPETQRPYIRRVRVSDARLDCLWCLRLRRSVNNAVGLRKHILNVWVAFHSRHIRTRRQRFSDVTAALH
jgi:hypothetical protein